VTRALGGESEVLVDVREVEVEPGDLYVLCSDGLTTMLEDEEILSYFKEGRPIEEICRRLVDEANQRGGLDNVTVVIAEILAGD
jgi:protein phosphatase